MANPVVKIRAAQTGSSYVVWCSTGPCDYADVAAGKVAAQGKQRDHAYRHRADRSRTHRREATS